MRRRAAGAALSTLLLALGLGAAAAGQGPEPPRLPELPTPIPTPPSLRGPAPPAQPAPPRAVIAFLPATPAPKQPLLDEFAVRGMAVGLTSPTLGGYSSRQMLLDVSQGSRVSTRVYPGRPRPLGLVTRGPGGFIDGWSRAVERARDISEELMPGLLADTLARNGRRVAYAGILGFEQVEAIAAADREGRVRRAELTTLGTFDRRAVRLWAASDVLVARLPPDEPGLDALDALLRARRERDLVYVVRAPPPGRLRLLATGIAGAGFAGRLRSETTRRSGLVSAPDVAPTVLEHLRVGVPDEMDGRPIESSDPLDPAADADAVREMGARLNVVTDRRGPALRALLGAGLLLLGILTLIRREAGLRAALRIGFLAALWAPGLALLAAALDPTLDAELVLLVLGGGVLAAATDRLAGWPFAPAVPAAVVLLAYAIDLAAGSPLTALSLPGPNPKGGARFYGIGNELEIILALTALIGAGAALTRAAASWALPGFGVAAALTAVVVGAGRLGADVGGVVTLAAGAGAACLAMLAATGRPPSRRAVIAAAAAPAAALGALILLDLLTGGGAHLTRTVLHADDAGELPSILERRLRISLSGLERFPPAARLALTLGLLAAAIWQRERLLAPLRDAPAFRAGLVGAVAATIVGAVVNDSGPLILLIAVAVLSLAAGYVHGRPRETRPQARRRAPAAA